MAASSERGSKHDCRCRSAGGGAIAKATVLLAASWDEWPSSMLHRIRERTGAMARWTKPTLAAASKEHAVGRGPAGKTMVMGAKDRETNLRGL